jgi:hypothetical protein
MTATISTLPVWKKGSTPAEWLSELVGLALENPEKWGRIVVVFEKTNEQGHGVESRYHSYGIETNTDVMGTLAAAQMEIFEYMKGRR